jgi:hypothetical protein
LSLRKVWLYSRGCEIALRIGSILRAPSTAPASAAVKCCISLPGVGLILLSCGDCYVPARESKLEQLVLERLAVHS